MREIVEWLVSIEHFANNIYAEATTFFQDDKVLAHFLEHIAADETEHYHLMASALQYIQSTPPRKAQIEIDDSIKTKIEAPFRIATDLLRTGSITRNTVIDCVVQSEFSEWNDLFNYVVNTLKMEDRIFAHAASRIEQHLRYIEHFLNSTAYGKERLETFTRLPYAKKITILIVDDEVVIAELVASLLEDICNSDLAANGEEALQKIRENVYDLVISDVGMPKMDGLELYNRAKSLFAKPNEVFIFHTGNLTADLRRMFETNKLAFLEKPASIMKIRNTVSEMFHLQ